MSQVATLLCRGYVSPVALIRLQFHPQRSCCCRICYSCCFKPGCLTKNGALVFCEIFAKSVSVVQACSHVGVSGTQHDGRDKKTTMMKKTKMLALLVLCLSFFLDAAAMMLQCDAEPADSHVSKCLNSMWPSLFMTVLIVFWPGEGGGGSGDDGYGGEGGRGSGGSGVNTAATVLSALSIFCCKSTQ